MSTRRDRPAAGPSVTGPLAQLVKEFERLRDLCGSLREQLAHEGEEKRALARERDGLVAELARSGRQPREESSQLERAELRDLRELRRAVESERDRLTVELAGLKKRCAALEAQLEAGREEQRVAQEERACLEEQMRHLVRLVAMLTAENRLLSRDRKPGYEPTP